MGRARVVFFQFFRETFGVEFDRLHSYLHFVLQAAIAMTLVTAFYVSAPAIRCFRRGVSQWLGTFSIPL